MGDYEELVFGGHLCACCGANIEGNEKVYLQSDTTQSIIKPKGKKTIHGTESVGVGVPVICEDCINDY